MQPIAKHAYLIIAHNDFRLLNCLIGALDDARNDIFLHIDSKVEHLPHIETQRAGLFILKHRIDVRWGDFSQVEVELELFKVARDVQQDGRRYVYYHLISGVDFPLKSQDFIHHFLSVNEGKEFIGFFQGDASDELMRKVGCYHLFPKNFSKVRKINARNILRALFIRIQLLFGGIRNKDIEVVRGTNWVSITNDFVEYILSHKEEIQKRFRYTFCADEVYKHTLCWNSEFKNRVYDITDEARGCMRCINWIVTPDKSFLPSFTMSDYNRLRDSEALFARKFDEDNIDVVYRLREQI